MFAFYLIYDEYHQLIDIVKAPDNLYERDVSNAYGLLNGCKVDAYRRSPEEICSRMHPVEDIVSPN